MNIFSIPHKIIYKELTQRMRKLSVQGELNSPFIPGYFKLQQTRIPVMCTFTLHEGIRICVCGGRMASVFPKKSYVTSSWSWSSTDCFPPLCLVCICASSEKGGQGS